MARLGSQSEPYVVTCHFIVILNDVKPPLRGKADGHAGNRLSDIHLAAPRGRAPDDIVARAAPGRERAKSASRWALLEQRGAIQVGEEVLPARRAMALET